MQPVCPIGIFDSGYGGLTVFKSIKDKLPQYDYIYLGDNARTPYGDKPFETVYQYTLQAVQYLFANGCPLIILACNTASAKALRQIQKVDLPQMNAENRVLGVIRPSAETIGEFTTTNSIGIVGTEGTVRSNSYAMEIEKTYPNIKVLQQACPKWVPIIENNLTNLPESTEQIQKDINELLSQSNEIDTILLGCTHYPIIIDKIRQAVPNHITIVNQGDIVADKLQDYLQRHSEIAERITQNGKTTFLTTGSVEVFNHRATDFFGDAVNATQVHL